MADPKPQETKRFAWGVVTHPGIWACGGGREDLPPVLVGITFQVPQKEPEQAWWCYIGPRPEFENEFTGAPDASYYQQSAAVPSKITANMVRTSQKRFVDCASCGGGEFVNCSNCKGQGVVKE